MADQKKISQLPFAGGVSDADTFPCNQSVTTYRQTALKFKEYVMAYTGAFAGSAFKLTTSRDITMTGDGGWTVSFDGSGNATGAMTLATVPVSKGGTGGVTPQEARANLGVRSVSTSFVEGFEMTWGASSISMAPGAAYVPSLSRVVDSSAAIVVTLSGLTSGTFYHFYLAEIAGVSVIELSVTAPAATATGGFIKTGDSSRRYLSSVLANGATSVYKFAQNGVTIDYNVNVFQVLASGVSTTAATVDCSTAVPVTATHAIAMVNNSSTGAGTAVRIGNADMGTVSAALNRQYVNPASSGSISIVLARSAPTFSYIYDATPTSGLSLNVRVNGYVFRR